MAGSDKYRVWCNDENGWQYVWAENEPTTCPNNNLHVINSDKTAIVSKQAGKRPVDPSGKERIHQTSRKLGTTTYWTGTGDDITNPVNVGGGSSLFIDHDIGESTTQNVYIDFNCVENETNIHEGYIVWRGAEFDRASLEIVPITTATQAGTDTNYNLYGGYLVVPAVGDGTLAITPGY